MVKSDQLRNEFEAYFTKNFDFDSFDTYISASLFNDGKCLIGILPYDLMDSKLLAFKQGFPCYIWKTDCQVAEACVDNVVDYLKRHGYDVTLKGEAEDEWNVIKIKFGKKHENIKQKED